MESTINQVVSRRFVKKQQMSWTLKGAHLLLQTRTKVLNNELDEVFRALVPEVPAGCSTVGVRAEGGLTPPTCCCSLAQVLHLGGGSQPL